VRSQQGNTCLYFVSSRCDLHASAYKKKREIPWGTKKIVIPYCPCFFFKFASGHWGEKFCLLDHPSVKVEVQKSLLFLVTI
jgi:hypothetical protein